MTTKEMLKSVECFITINILESTTDLSYIDRLSSVVRLMNNNEKIFETFSSMFNNQNICQVMIRWIDTRYLY